jgi:polysaccharide export outer membrane protein
MQGKGQAFSAAAQYTIGPGDQLDVFVWRNPDLTVKVPVRPDGRISIPLVQDIQAAGKTSNQLADDIKTALLKFVKDPVVTVIVQSVQGAGDERIAVIGNGMPPKSIAYRAGITVMDVMVEVGGLKEFSAGNSAKLLRHSSSGVAEMPLRLADLLEDGDQTANVTLQPGDVIRIPERWF